MKRECLSREIAAMSWVAPAFMVCALSSFAQGGNDESSAAPAQHGGHYEAGQEGKSKQRTGPRFIRVRPGGTSAEPNQDETPLSAEGWLNIGGSGVSRGPADKKIGQGSQPGSGTGGGGGASSQPPALSTGVVRVQPADAKMVMDSASPVVFTVTGIASKGDTLVCYQVLKHPSVPQAVKDSSLCNKPADFVPFTGNTDWTYSDSKRMWTGTFRYDASMWGTPGIQVRSVFKDKKTGLMGSGSMTVVAAKTAGVCPQYFITERAFDFRYSGATQIMIIKRGQASAIKFTTDKSGKRGSIVTAYSSSGPEVPKFMNISTNKCDFNYDNLTNGTYCAATRSIGVSLAYTLGTKPITGRCKLEPDTTYYVNIRNEDAHEAARGVDTCPVGT
ncbi:MAG: hypothetical protein PHS14_03985, partial [Elusimicrobia bacterium]|nr:hypothetical protein [Elusimicrobiota bacterium]